MPNRVNQRPTLVFNKGLITEGSDLSFPEGASVDELNMELEKNGSRRRRLGFIQETNGEFFSASHSGGDIVSVNIWENVGGVDGLNYAVVQHKNTLHFYEEADGSISSSKKSFTVNLSNYNRPAGAGASSEEVDMTSIRGTLIVASSEINTIKIKYDDDTDTISVSEIVFYFRDFSYQGTPSDYYEPTASSTISSERLYDSYNSGWFGLHGGGSGQQGGNAFLQWNATLGTWPPLNAPWFASKNASNVFDANAHESLGGTTSLSGLGRFVLNLYEGNRQTVSGVAGLDTPENTRFSAVTTYAGRVFYSGLGNEKSNNIYFSQIIFQDDNLGECHQKNDPTAEIYNDLLDTDGGVLSLNGAYNIKKLHVLGPYLIAFAENGVWLVKGVDDVFRATEYSVSKISEIGIGQPSSFVSALGRPYWWSDYGIHTLTSDDSGGLREVNITTDTIKSYFNEIPPSKRRQVKSTYDKLNNKVFWMYPSSDEVTNYKYNEILVFDEPLRAFYPWRIEDPADNQFILAPFFLGGSVLTSTVFNVIDSNNDQVQDSLGNDVVVTREQRDYVESAVTCLYRNDSGQLSFGLFNDTGFLDWGEANYSSYVESGYDFVGDLSSHKVPTYITTFMRVTETGYEGSEEDGYTAVFPSSCLVTAYWDFRSASGSAAQQAYRLKNLRIPDGTAFVYPRTVTTSRLKLKGRGRSFRVRFESEQGKEMDIIGFDVITGLTGK